MADLDANAPDPATTRAFARKVRLSTWALFFERLWPRFWVLLGVIAAFVGVSFAGVWPTLAPLTHQILLGAYALAAAAALVYAVRAPWPSREEAIRRIERRSGVPHRPASSYEDTLSAQSAHADTGVIWQAHRERLARAIQRLKVGTPSPRADRFDPFAFRALAMLLLIPAALLATGSLTDRFASAFRFGGGHLGADARLDAWVTPPPYTALPPVLLADGGQTKPAEDNAKGKLIEVPERSLLTLRGAGFGGSGLSIEVLNEGAAGPEMVAAAPAKKDDKAAIAEVRYELKRSAIVRALAGSRELGQWTFGVIPDIAPKIALSKPLDRTPRGSLKLAYTAEDDYGVASAAAKVRQSAPKPGDPSRAWAKAPELTGPRLPLERPPVLDLKLPRPGAKTVDASTLLELGAHPWAGQRVELWLEATDVGGNIGRSAPVELVLPARRFTKPLARALIEQRRKLAEDSRNRPNVARALNALAIEPEDFIKSSSVFLNLRSLHYRLASSGGRATIKESVDQLWNLALLVEDGALSEAERALKDAQDKLSDALQKGADDEELQQLMAELKQKLNDYLNEMQKQAAENQQPGDEQQQGEELAQQDVDEMMNELEKSAREGSREDAEKMLSELRELMDRLQAGTPEQKAEQQRAQEMMKKLNQLGNIAGKQQKLMDETYNEQKKPGQDGDPVQGDKNSGDQTGQNQRQGKSGQQGQQRGQQSDTGPSSGQELGGEKQAQGEQGQGPSGKNGDNPGKLGLKERQAQLRQQLDQLQKELEQMGVGDPDKLGQAEDAMGKAEDALEQGDMEEAAQQQAEALDKMREGAQAMTEQMQKNAQQKVGKGGDQPRDPLGRPQRSQGPDLGTSVKVPGAIDAQRAREILDELRKRSGESLRPPVELDYIDRLLRRF
ncbi:MAG: TIGR02302 family protein [Hyphomicrobium sp.]